MDDFGFFEKRHIPKYNDPDQIKPGEIEVDHDKCSGCSICMQACVVSAIVMQAKKPVMLPPGRNECIFCGCCVAICPEGAIRLKSPYRYTGLYKTIGHGEPEPPRL